MQEICKKIIEKNCFLAKTLIGKETKKIRKGRKGGALIRAGAHIRDNTVIMLKSAKIKTPQSC